MTILTLDHIQEAKDAGRAMDLDMIAKVQYDWVARMNWHNKTVLEALAMIAGELGEAADEMSGIGETDAFGIELADIVLRVVDLAEVTGYSIGYWVGQAVIAEPTSLKDTFIQCQIDYSAWVNAACERDMKPDFAAAMGMFTRRVLSLATQTNVDLFDCIVRKMRINEERGTRNR